MSIFGRRNKKGNYSINLQYVDGIKNFPIDSAIALSINKEENLLEIKARAFKNVPVVKLNFNQIISFDLLDKKTIIEKQKSVVGRAIVGDILLGPVGAIIGGMTGIGTKKSLQNDLFLIFNYTSKDNEIKVLTFKVIGATLHLTSFINELKEVAPLDRKRIEKLKESLNIDSDFDSNIQEIIL